MTYAYVQDVPNGTMKTHDEITARLGDERPHGLVVHLVGPTDEGIRMIDVWESEEDFLRFRDERLRPASNGVDGDAIDPASVRVEVLDVQHRW
jgi:hypothetical protein